VYDISGKKIETMVNQNMQAGYYRIDWNASKYSSGVYYYRLEAGEFTEAKKMVLLK
jgi:hypothetical protein